jgi:hypothetical protein
VIDAVCRDRELRPVGAVDVLPLGEIPERKLDVFLRAADETFEVTVENSWSPWIRSTTRV